MASSVSAASNSDDGVARSAASFSSSNQETATRRRRVLHEPVPPPKSLRPIAAHLERANATLRDRIGSLSTARKAKEDRTRKAFTARVDQQQQRIATAEATQRHQRRYLAALSEWKSETVSTAGARNRQAIAASLKRHKELSDRGETIVRESVPDAVVPAPPKRVETGTRYERLLAPLEKVRPVEQQVERLQRRLYDFHAAQTRLRESRAVTAERKHDSRLEREFFVRQRAEEQEAAARAQHVANTIRSELALQRAQRTKERVRNPRRAMAEERLAQREAERLQRAMEATLSPARGHGRRFSRSRTGAAAAPHDDEASPDTPRDDCRDGHEADPFPAKPGSRSSSASSASSADAEAGEGASKREM